MDKLKKYNSKHNVYTSKTETHKQKRVEALQNMYINSTLKKLYAYLQYL